VSEKQLVLDVIQRLPASATFEQMRERIEFLAALRTAEESLDRGEGVPQAEVERQFATRVKRWHSKSSGRPKR
jgi:hypothetical protein